MSKIPLLSDELATAADILEWHDEHYVNGTSGAHIRVRNILRAKAAALRNKGKPKPKRKTVMGYVGSRHTKIKVQGLFDEEDK